ncbi:conserved hypothetical protein, partial [Streptomyces clavuligerus]
ACRSHSGPWSTARPGTRSDRPPLPTGPGPVRIPLTVDPALLDRTLAELDALETELTAVLPGDDPGLALLRARLGGVCATRYLAGPTETDRRRGVAALRAARASGALDTGADRSARAHLLMLLLPPVMLSGTPDGSLHGLQNMHEAGRLLSRRDPENLRDLHELSELITGFLPELPTGQASFAQSYAQLFDAYAGVRTYRDLDRATEVLQGFLERFPEQLTGPFDGFGDLLKSVRDLDHPHPDRGVPDRPADDANGLRDLAFLLRTNAPGLLRPQELKNLVDEGRGGSGNGEPVETLLNALLRLAGGMGTGDYRELAEAARLMDAMGEGAAPEPLEPLARILQPVLLTLAGRMGGNLTDRDHARDLFDSFLASGTPALDAPDPHLRELRTHSRFMHTLFRLGATLEGNRAETGHGPGNPGGPGDPDELDTMLAELLRLRSETDTDGPGHYSFPLQTGLVRLEQAVRDSSLPTLRAALADLREGMDHPDVPALARPLLDTLRAFLTSFSTWYEPDTTETRAAVEQARRSLGRPSFTADQQVATRLGIGYALTNLYHSHRDHAALTEAVEELETARGDLDLAGTVSPEIARRVLWALADAYRLRGDPDRGDRAAAVTAARDSLRVVAEDVLLQLSAEHSLEAARAGASKGLSAARWAADDGRADLVVEALETGRAIVLRSVAASAGVAEQLSARGEQELAERWRTAARPGRGIPSELRRRALDTLRHGHRGAGDPLAGLLGVPGTAELRDGVRAAGAHALVYLVPGADTDPGLALLVPRSGEPRTVRPAGLTPHGQGPLTEYLDAGAHRSAVRAGTAAARDAAHERWEAALDALCDWAGASVMEPVLGALGVDPADGEEVRLVLVVCGNLGAVPWHAARLAPGRGTVPAPSRPRAYLCERAVVSYAASGGEFLRATARARRRPDERVVLVADPTADLEWAQDEVLALRDAHYPDALLYGWYDDLPEDAPGTPDEVLSLLPGRPSGAPEAAASLVHLVVHGTAGLRPTDSVLRLAAPDGSAEGRLTVTRVLDLPDVPTLPDGTAEAASGPLVVLSACETDLSSRDHDEALTPTTALLARGATDVVGSRWEVSDGASAALMVVFHHHLTVGALAPPDALRAAQRWMLDPDRRPVPGLRSELLTRTDRQGARLTAVVAWAAFIHQGNPSAVGRHLG